METGKRERYELLYHLVKGFILEDELKQGNYEAVEAHFQKQMDDNVKLAAVPQKEGSDDVKNGVKVICRVAKVYSDKMMGYFALLYFGMHLLSNGQLEDGIKQFRRSLVYANSMNNISLQCRSYSRMGLAYRSLEIWDEALESFNSIIKLAVVTGDRYGSSSAYANAGDCYLGKGNMDEALKNFLKAKEQLTSSEAPQGLNCFVSRGVGMVYLRIGNYGEAIKNLNEAIRIASGHNYLPGKALSLVSLSEAKFMSGNHDEATTDINHAIEIAENCGHDEIKTKAMAIKNKQESIIAEKDEKDNAIGEACYKEMECPICFEIAQHAVETSCCHQVYCERCLSLVRNGPCPQCRRRFEIIESHVSRRIIGNLPANCSFAGCKAKVCRSEIKDHEARCEHRLFKCPALNCLYEGVKKNFLMHLITEHEDAVLKFSPNLFPQLRT